MSGFSPRYPEGSGYGGDAEPRGDPPTPPAARPLTPPRRRRATPSPPGHAPPSPAPWPRPPQRHAPPMAPPRSRLRPAPPRPASLGPCPAPPPAPGPCAAPPIPASPPPPPSPRSPVEPCGMGSGGRGIVPGGHTRARVRDHAGHSSAYPPGTQPHACTHPRHSPAYAPTRDTAPLPGTPRDLASEQKGGPPLQPPPPPSHLPPPGPGSGVEAGGRGCGPEATTAPRSSSVPKAQFPRGGDDRTVAGAGVPLPVSGDPLPLVRASLRSAGAAVSSHQPRPGRVADGGHGRS